MVRKYITSNCTTKANIKYDVDIQNENEEESRNFYDEIDDTQILEEIEPVVVNTILPNANTIATHEHNGNATDHQGSESRANEGIFQYCNAEQGSIKDDHHSPNGSSTQSTSDSDYQIDRSCDADYLNPYHTLDYIRQTLMHDYETNVTIHAVDSQ